MTEENLTPEGEQPETAAPSPEGEPAGEAEPAADEATPEADELAVTKIALEERTLDLQRLQAEYLNYKRRVERDRELLRENATYTALAPIVDDPTRAHIHADASEVLVDLAAEVAAIAVITLTYLRPSLPSWKCTRPSVSANKV